MYNLHRPGSEKKYHKLTKPTVVLTAVVDTSVEASRRPIDASWQLVDASWRPVDASWRPVASWRFAVRKHHGGQDASWRTVMRNMKNFILNKFITYDWKMSENDLTRKLQVAGGL